MTDYHPLIARAVEGLDKSTGEARRALYERARTALVTQLRGVEPALPESEITKERLALEEAIRKVEAETARKSRLEPRKLPAAATLPRAPARETGTQAAAPPAPSPRRDRAAPPPPVPASEPPKPVPAEPRRSDRNWAKQNAEQRVEAEAPRRTGAAVAREPLAARRTGSLSQEGKKGFRSVMGGVHDLDVATAKAAPSAREKRESFAPPPPQNMSLEEEIPAPSEHDHFEPLLDPKSGIDAREAQQWHGLEQSYEAEVEPPPMYPRPQPPRTMEEEQYQEQRPPRSYRRLIRLLVMLIILVGVVATISWQWSNITGMFAQIGSRQQQGQTGHETPTPQQPKYSGRVPQDQGEGQGPAAATPGGQTAPAVAQRVVLYEEDPNDPQGRRYIGSAIWRTETVSPGAGLAPELAIRANVEIPERRMTVMWSLRRNTDKALPASHTIEIMFTLPADFPGGAIANVPGILMKQAEQARGTPLSGSAVKVTNGYFLIGLSAIDADMQRNIQLLKDRDWFDIPVVYTNGGRAILAMEKGPPGDRVFAEAFAAWGK